MKALLPLLLLTSCVELRKGWVRVDWLDGQPHAEVVCQVGHDKDGDLEMECVDMRLVATEMLKSLKKPVAPGDL